MIFEYVDKNDEPMQMNGDPLKTSFSPNKSLKAIKAQVSPENKSPSSVQKNESMIQDDDFVSRSDSQDHPCSSIRDSPRDPNQEPREQQIPD